MVQGLSLPFLIDRHVSQTNKREVGKSTYLLREFICPSVKAHIFRRGPVRRRYLCTSIPAPENLLGLYIAFVSPIFFRFIGVQPIFETTIVK